MAARGAGVPVIGLSSTKSWIVPPERIWVTGTPAWESLRAQASPRSLLERGTEVADHAELGEDDRAFGVAVEAFDLAAGQLEDVAARRVHPLTGVCWLSRSMSFTLTLRSDGPRLAASPVIGRHPNPVIHQTRTA